MKGFNIIFGAALCLSISATANAADVATTITTTATTASGDNSPTTKLIEGFCVLSTTSCEALPKVAKNQPKIDYCENYYSDKRPEAEANYKNACEKEKKRKDHPLLASYDVSLTYFLRNDVAFLLKQGKLVHAKDIPTTELKLKGEVVRKAAKHRDIDHSKMTDDEVADISIANMAADDLERQLAEEKWCKQAEEKLSKMYRTCDTSFDTKKQTKKQKNKSAHKA